MIINGRKLLPWLVLILLVVLASSIAERSLNKIADFTNINRNHEANNESAKEDTVSTFSANKQTLVIQPDFFIDYKLERDRIRSQQLDLLEKLIDSPQSTKEISEEIKEQLKNIIKTTNVETELESLIKAKGFNDAVVIIRDDTADAIIKSESLNQEQAVQILDLVNRITKIPMEAIKIIPRI